MGALQQHVAEKDAGLNMAREENARLKDGMGMYQKELERLTSENRILKRAVGIQNTKGKEVGFDTVVVVVVGVVVEAWFGWLPCCT